MRKLDKEMILQQIQSIISNTGYDEVSLTSLSSSDYPQVLDLLRDMESICESKQVALSLPSLRIDSYSTDINYFANKIRQSGVTLAPEAGSQFLRDVISKDVSEEEILNTMRIASKNTNKALKLYFMIGLPREEKKDLEELVDLAFRIIQEIKPARNKIIINISNFVPKPFTPFQWCKQDSIEEINNKLNFFKKNLRHKQLEMRWTDPEVSLIEGILCRGDKKVGQLIYAAYKNGANFDAWYDHFQYEFWQKAILDYEFDVGQFTTQTNPDDLLPWDFINAGVEKNKLVEEYTKSLEIQRQELFI